MQSDASYLGPGGPGEAEGRMWTPVNNQSMGPPEGHQLLFRCCVRVQRTGHPVTKKGVTFNVVYNLVFKFGSRFQRFYVIFKLKYRRYVKSVGLQDTRYEASLITSLPRTLVRVGVRGTSAAVLQSGV